MANSWQICDPKIRMKILRFVFLSLAKPHGNFEEQLLFLLPSQFSVIFRHRLALRVVRDNCPQAVEPTRTRTAPPVNLHSCRLIFNKKKKFWRLYENFEVRCLEKVYNFSAITSVKYHKIW